MQNSQLMFDALVGSDMPIKREFKRIDMEDADVWYCKSWIKSQQADRLLTYFIEHLQWQQVSIQMFGKSCKVPRLQAWYGDEGSDYAYSGLSMSPLPWESKLKELKKYCELSCQTQFNSVLANYYRDGSDSMGMHSDNEPELGAQPVIASVSLGELRNFDFKHIKTKQKQRLLLEHGSLLIMRGDTQRYWHHGINKSKKLLGPRLNFTFRQIK
ncbi:alpha-ketoglutarate-dependent dioxygenase AlkB family protein [Ningiella sp. W23]|uniref:alpha-ketoglutarate-dependent dioxygenase AlkB family protein n=1 Tax=Ningiella sp. W23 TaxID=3023715 RepID=UPI0037579188